MSDFNETIRKYSQIIGENIRRFRQEVKLTKVDLAKLAEVDRNTIIGAESGKNPQLDTIIKISHALKISPYQLLLSDEDKKDIRRDPEAPRSG